ncbi:MAG: Zn-ribbon domain-containing OB-fold protein [Promethearchaeota archaeon]
MTVDEKIKWKRCNKCGFLQHISHLRCLKCKYHEFTQIDPLRFCKLLTYTILTSPPLEFRNQKSYALGVVEFDNKIKALGQITTEENLYTGMVLKPKYKKICESLDGKEIYNYVFDPA